MITLSPFHRGEQAVQLKAGGQQLRDAVEQMGWRVVRDFMPQQHREFFSNQQLLYFAAQNPAAGTVWASVLAGAPGFISSPDPTLLSIAGPAHVAGDPAADGLAVGSRIGLLGLELTTRRRNRMNGTVLVPQQDGELLIAVDQSFGNCPKYIQSREVELDPVLLQRMSTQVLEAVQSGTNVLGPEQVRLLSAADTFFLATSNTSDCSVPSHKTDSQAVEPQVEPQLAGEIVPAAAAAGLAPLPTKPAACGLDISHRGGAPGFVVVSSDGKSLRWPDYKGNDMFNSFGNLAINPAAGLLFIDWSTGSTLQLTGTAAVHYDDTSLPGGNRTVVFQVASWRHAHKALPIKQATFLNASPYNPAVLQPADTSAAAAAAAAGEWLTCADVRVEADGIKSYFFHASVAMRSLMADGKWPYQPGQYASFNFQLKDLSDQPSQAAADKTFSQPTGAPTAADSGAFHNGTSSSSSSGQVAAAAGSAVINRTWTISSHPVDTVATGLFSITVKRAGRVSNYLWSYMRPGSRVLFTGVGGTFTLEGCTQRPLLLVAGGIGITPLRSMFKESIRQGRPVTLIYSVSQAAEAAFLKELVEAAEKANAAAVKATAAAPTGAAEAAAGDATEGATITAAAPQLVLPSLAYQVYLTVTRGPSGVPGQAGSAAAAALPRVQQHKGRVTAAVLRKLVPDSVQRCVFLCGPGAFMDAVTSICSRELGHSREPETESFDY